MFAQKREAAVTLSGGGEEAFASTRSEAKA
jgi:hypothetical protein